MFTGGIVVKYQELEASLNLPALQEELLPYWKQNRVFEKSLEGKSSEVVFYDGPPFPTGTPHHGTVLVSFIKDMIARYWTMRGYSVPRVWGWDCHGLPIENQAEKRLGLSDKSVIERSVDVASADEAAAETAEDGSKKVNAAWHSAVTDAMAKRAAAGSAFSRMHAGMTAFNDECLNIVSSNNEAWREYIDQMARWVDYDNAYKTMNPSFMESVMWAFKTCYDKGLIYSGYRVTPYCMHCGTSLSISDTRESDSTRPRQDRWIIARFRAEDEAPMDGKPVFYLAWTTTPWTLPSNLALAVNKGLTYAYVDVGDAVYVACKNTLANFKKVFGEEPKILKECTGAEMVGRKYEPLLPYFASMREQGAFRVVDADYVDATEGVGIVHTAPAFGEDDYWTCRKWNIPTDIVNPVDGKGRFTEEVTDFYEDSRTRNVIEMNPIIIRFLYAHDKAVADGTMVHNYPHCWRCKNPLIYKAMSAWYFKIGETREALKAGGMEISDEEMARTDIYSDSFFAAYGVKEALIDANHAVNWVPETVKYGRFGNWLTNARDWNISRNRYWSTPIPIWECDCCGKRTVLGSVEEIRQKSGITLTDLHRQYMDQVTFPCECGGVNHRVQEVLDCWFESGSVTYAQKHYPFENKAWFENHFPCDFIVEYTGQIRCWFYYMHVMSVALFGRPAFKNCVVHGTLLADDGKKFSKSSRNYTDPMKLMKTLGTDAFRLYLFQTNSMLMGDSKFDEDGIRDAYQQLIAPLWNACNFFIPLANSDAYHPDSLQEPVTDHLLDRWMLAKLHETEQTIRTNMDAYQVDGYVTPLVSLMEGLTNWYIRRSRRRFWGSEMTEDKKAAYDTLYYVLVSILKLYAPVAPYLSEKLYRILTGEESVHLAVWPQIPDRFADDRLLADVELTRRVIRLGRSIREKQNIKNRQPLQLMQVAMNDREGAEVIRSFSDLIREELNIKQLEILDEVDSIATVSYKPCFPVIGQKYPQQRGSIIKAVQTGRFTIAEDKVRLEVNGEEQELDSDVLLVSYEARKGMHVASENGVVLSLDTTITEELRREGIAREVIRNIQDARKNMNYNITDRIALAAEGDIPAEWMDYIASETLGTFGTVDRPDTTVEIGEGKHRITVAIARI